MQLRVGVTAVEGEAALEGRTAWERERANVDRGDKMGRREGWPKTGQETLIDKWRGERQWSTHKVHIHTHNTGQL